MDLTLQWAYSPELEGLSFGRSFVEHRLDGVHRELNASDVGDVAFERCDPVRSFPSWRGKRHYDAHQWMGCLGRSVGFESLLERACLIELDRIASVVAVSSQPMWIRWHAAGAVREHVPDYFARLDDNSGVLIDVKPTKRNDDRVRAQFDLTALFCRERGWRYVVFEDASKTREANLRFLARYQSVPDIGEVPRLPSGGAPLAVVAELLGEGPDGYARCYSQLWHGGLQMDLESPLKLNTTLRRKDA